MVFCFVTCQFIPAATRFFCHIGIYKQLDILASIVFGNSLKLCVVAGELQKWQVQKSVLGGWKNWYQPVQVLRHLAPCCPIHSTGHRVCLLLWEVSILNGKKLKWQILKSFLYSTCVSKSEITLQTTILTEFFRNEPKMSLLPTFASSKFWHQAN